MCWPLLCLVIAGCSPLYVVRAGYEELRILMRREPIEQLLEGEVAAETRTKLEIILGVREFARDQLGLSVGGSYSTLARVDDDQIVHVVTAAPWNRLEPYTWWFPIVGRVPYRGYFDRADAEALAEKLQGKGYDTYVRPSVAFSTLGWFDDPLLSNLLRHEVTTLADIVIHELLHSTIYLAGQTPFNESFANFVGGRGAVLFFDRRGEEDLAERARARYADTLDYSVFLGEFVTRLERAYADGVGRELREEIFAAAQEEFRRHPWRTKTYHRFGQVALNNALIVHQWMYARRLDLFERAYVESGEDLAVTIERIRRACEGAKDPFEALTALPGN